MEQIIKIQTKADGTKAVSAFELYKQLGFSQQNFVRWKLKNITETEKECDEWYFKWKGKIKAYQKNLLSEF